MVAKDFEIKNTIVSYLRNNENGASASDISKQIGFNRITVGKYLQILQAEKIVSSKKVASAIYWQLSHYSSKPKILIVDDDPHIVNLIKLSLLNKRFELYEAYDGKEALDIVNKIFPDLIILDLMMPKTSGEEVCKKLKTNILTKNIPILILSAKGDIKNKIDLINLGADDYMTKPFDPVELEARVSNKVLKLETNYSTNPITHLPSPLFVLDVKNIWIGETKWFELKLSLENLPDFINFFGYKKSLEVLQFFSKLLVEIFNTESFFIGHESDNSFVIFSKVDLDLKMIELKNKFNKTIPYFYSGIIDFTFSEKNSPLEIIKDGKLHKLISLKLEVLKHDS